MDDLMLHFPGRFSTSRTATQFKPQFVRRQDAWGQALLPMTEGYTQHSLTTASSGVCGAGLHARPVPFARSGATQGRGVKRQLRRIQDILSLSQQPEDVEFARIFLDEQVKLLDQIYGSSEAFQNEEDRYKFFRSAHKVLCKIHKVNDDRRQFEHTMKKLDVASRAVLLRGADVSSGMIIRYVWSSLCANRAKFPSQDLLRRAIASQQPVLTRAQVLPPGGCLILEGWRIDIEHIVGPMLEVSQPRIRPRYHCLTSGGSPTSTGHFRSPTTRNHWQAACEYGGGV
jgi:hypothetical protein